MAQRTKAPEGQEAGYPYRLELTINEPEIIAEIVRVPDGFERQTYIIRALRLGLLALRTARGEVDAQAIKEQLGNGVKEIETKLREYQSTLKQQLDSAVETFKMNTVSTEEQRSKAFTFLLAEYRRELLSGIDSVIKGSADPLLKVLDPNSRTGVVDTMKVSVQQELNNMAERIKREVLTQFSRDSEGSALSRVVEVVAASSRSIVEQFSMDNPTSALRRLQDSVSEQMQVLTRSQLDFQGEVQQALSALSVRKTAEAASTTHGLVYEEVLGVALRPLVERHGHLLDATGSTTGTIRSCKVGDYVAVLGPDAIGAGERVVIEAKSAGGYDLPRILAEAETGRKNRGAQICIFVIDTPYAPPALPAGFIYRHGDTIIAKWSPGDSDAALLSSLAIAFALVTSAAKVQESSTVDAAEMENAVNEILRRVQQMVEVSQWATTIQSSSTKILDRMRISLDAITSQAETLMNSIKSMKHGPVA